MQGQYPRKIIFDMDGVITSENCYWNTAALVVWELLYSQRGLGLPLPPGLPSFAPDLPAPRVAAVRRVIFQDDRVISFFKRRAVNSNWDLAFFTFVFQLALFLNYYFAAKPQTLELLLKGNALSVDHLPLLRRQANCRERDAWYPPSPAIHGDWCGEARGAEVGTKLHALLRAEALAALVAQDSFLPTSALWEGVRRIFQEWYLGDDGYLAHYGQLPGVRGKGGFITEEQPLLPVQKVRTTLQELRRQGWTLGIATGRPANELLPPLQQMGLWQFFDHASVITFDQVEQAQQMMEAKGENIALGKPHPFSLLKAYWERTYAQEVYIYPPFPSPRTGSCYLVGDAPADLLAARSAGIPFIAVLTGHEGTNGRSLFTGEGVSAVLEDMTRIPAFLEASSHPDWIFDA